MRLLSSKTLYIKSEHCVGTPWDFKLTIPDGILSCHDSEAIRISLMSHEVQTSWDNVTIERNELTINGESIIIPPGNYTYRQMADKLTELYAATANAVTMTCEYLASYNRLLFTFSASSSIAFIGKSYELLGFSGGTVYSGIDNTIESDTAMKPRIADNMTVGLRDVILRSHAFETRAGESLKTVTHLANIPITSPPYGLNVWRSAVDGDASLFIADKHINSLRFVIYTDNETTPATFLPHSHLVVRADTFLMDESADMLDHLSKIAEYSRLQFVQQGLAADK